MQPVLEFDRVGKSYKKFFGGTEAVALYQACAARYPDDEWTLRKAADMSFHFGDFQAAAAYFEKKRRPDVQENEADSHLMLIWWE